MDAETIAQRRALMTRSAAELLAVGPNPVIAEGPGWFVTVSGADSVDTNFALVVTGDLAVRAEVLRIVDAAGVPVAVGLAGDASDVELGGSWVLGGLMPFMAADLDEVPMGRDPRVRTVTSEQADEAAQVVCDAFGLEWSAGGFIGEVARREDIGPRLFCLEEAGEQVSAVVSHVFDGVACIWCMATPVRFQRHGYGRALLADVLARARSQGARLGLLGATEAGKPLYDLTGWKTIEQWKMHVKAAVA